MSQYGVYRLVKGVWIVSTSSEDHSLEINCKDKRKKNFKEEQLYSYWSACLYSVLVPLLRESIPIHPKTSFISYSWILSAWWPPFRQRSCLYNESIARVKVSIMTTRGGKKEESRYSKNALISTSAVQLSLHCASLPIQFLAKFRMAELSVSCRFVSCLVWSVAARRL